MMFSAHTYKLKELFQLWTESRSAPGALPSGPSTGDDAPRLGMNRRGSVSSVQSRTSLPAVLTRRGSAIGEQMFVPPPPPMPALGKPTVKYLLSHREWSVMLDELNAHHGR